MSSIWLRVHDRTPIIHKVGLCDPMALTSGRNITPTRTQVGRDSTNFCPSQRLPRTFICLSSAKLLCCGTTNRLCIAFCWIRCLGVLFSGPACPDGVIHELPCHIKQDSGETILPSSSNVKALSLLILSVSLENLYSRAA